ncbi:cysteine--tRNA ligase [Leucobacter sp. UT-8R-CII-1-4]|uniref:cysteine--tRNA ligase n=1 Tax=Leucobacter sp. UT-8R-CII-1-4 TaxID=3040075 RepID=UPI0024A8B9D8|nr:cysteine--tRNA ligase [Leucobacter sp. UT-8R-CII-1-4]MDI6023921.1 cysteine--tRNA ligase [Leucobacter sp. UT-8R-CII-1-4]
MKQRIYDSRMQSVVDFDPIKAGEVGMYVCGPTVQSAPHIGHLRSALVYDQIRRWFSATGHQVTLIRNVTDIDDKILDNARIAQESGGSEPWWALAYRVEREFTAAYDALGVLAPVYEPRATANIAEMVELIEQLIERGHAYQAEDGTASVYFDTASWPEYGALTRQRREQMEDAADSEPVGKRDPRDFALWKAYREHEPESASWPSPWGRGRPGWHIECSAMAAHYLGDAFDIHGGGLDLRFPHHENELAQSTAAGQSFAKHWIHNGLVNTGGQKMSKSLGNSLFAADLLTATRPLVLRYFLGSAHYRSVLEFSESSLDEAAAAFSRIEGFLERAWDHLAASKEDATAGEAFAALYLSPLEGKASAEMLPAAFSEAMLDDFGIPQALAALHGAVRAGNVAIDENNSEALIARAAEVVAMLDVLGLDPRSEQWADQSANGDSAREQQALDTLITGMLAERRAARDARDFATSDAIRDRLTAAGIALEDGQQETRWSLT